MRNQKGEAILFCVLILVALSGLLTLCSLELQHHFSSMKKRTTLFLCVKETKGELHLYLKSMGRLNWLLQNVSRAQMIAIFYPPLWPVVGNAEKLKKVAISENDPEDIDGILDTFAELLIYKCVNIVEKKGYQTEEILCRYFGIDY